MLVIFCGDFRFVYIHTILVGFESNLVGILFEKGRIADLQPCTQVKTNEEKLEAWNF